MHGFWFYFLLRDNERTPWGNVIEPEWPAYLYNPCRFRDIHLNKNSDMILLY